jgi:hypothetical protein
MYGDLECPGSNAPIGTTAPGGPEPTTADQLQDRKTERPTVTPPTGRSGFITCRVGREDELVADLQVYVKLFCRRRALIEIGDDRVAVHFEAAGEAAIFSGLWTAWMAAGLVPTSRCRHHDEFDRLSIRKGEP